jgi:D-amino-acid dehydrogenase
MSEKLGVTVICLRIVGLCCARTLQRRGRTVTVIDPDEPGSGTSFGNAGLLSTGSVLPEGHPGFWKRLPKLLLDPTGPLTIRPRYLPKMLPWLLRFMASTTPTSWANTLAGW